MELQSYVKGGWETGSGNERELFNAVTGEAIGRTSTEGFDFSAVLDYARTVGGPALRKMTFHERSLMLKALAKYLMQHKDEFYPISYMTGATKADSWIDIEGGISTVFVFSSKGRREFPDEPFYIDGAHEQISKNGTFLGRHICVPLEGAAIHINAFNFPCWGMLEKLAPTLLAGVPAIVKPATATSFLTEAMFKRIIESKTLPEGAVQLLCGGVGDLLDHLTCQDVVTFTGSASTGLMLKQHKTVVENSVRFNMEADSLNCSILGPNDDPSTEEFKLFIKEVAKEMTVKAGQKCTAIRRVIIPEKFTDDVVKSLKERLARITIGNPENESVRMGPLASRGQVDEVMNCVKQIADSCEQVYGNLDDYEVVGADKEKGAFFPSIVFLAKNPLAATAPHNIEPFGPVSTLMPYSSVDEAIELAKLGKGSLCGSLVTYDDAVAKQVVMGTAAYHGRIMVLNRDCAAESTGHGSPLPHLIHGGPGRAGGGEEMGGKRGVLHYMQRTALQGSPTTLTAVCNQYIPGAKTREDRVHPFRKYFEELEVGDSLLTARRTVTEADIVNFAGVSGDYFYAHMDEIAAKDSLFERRVAHGYFVLSAAAGLFVDGAPGPVAANYGLDDLRFTAPVYPGDTIQVRLTVKQKTPKANDPHGVVHWDVQVTNQDAEIVAAYTILTLVKCREFDETDQKVH